MRTAHARILIAILTVVTMSAAVPPASAQTVVDATTAEFEPSTDHSAVSPEGTPLLTFYLLELIPVGASTPSHSIDLGRPSPGADGLIRVAFASLLPSPLVGGTIYQARIAAVGPGGRATSGLSNSFATSAPCSPVLSETSASVAAAGSTTSIAVSTGTTCEWTATANNSWLSITSPTPVTGSNAVNFAAAANTATSQRTGTLTIAGETVTITQAAGTGGSGPGCTYSINPTNRTAPVGGETVAVAVTAPSGCPWTATPGNSFLSVTSGSNGSGNGTVNVRVAPSSGSSQRSGNVTIAGRSFAVTQLGNCNVNVTPATVTAPAAGTTSTLSVSTSSTCSWSPTGLPTWITVPPGTRTGPGNVTFTISVNAGAARSVTLTIANRSITVNQGAATVSPPSNFRIIKTEGGQH